MLLSLSGTRTAAGVALSTLLIACSTPGVGAVSPPRQDTPTFDGSDPAAVKEAPLQEGVADSVDASTVDGDDEWTYVIAPYFWLLGVDGTASIGPVEADIDESFSDLLDKISYVLETRFEAWKGKWGYTIDLTYGRLEEEADFGPVELDVETDLLLVGGSVNRMLYDAPLRDDGSGRVKVEGNLGVLFTHADTELDLPSPLMDRDNDVNIVDPVVGVRTTIHLDERNFVRAAGLVGGFDATDDSSDLAWGLEVYYGRRFGPNRALWMGYRFLSLDFDEDNLELDIEISGPAIGFAWSF